MLPRVDDTGVRTVGRLCRLLRRLLCRRSLQLGDLRLQCRDLIGQLLLQLLRGVRLLALLRIGQLLLRRGDLSLQRCNL
jgi:hypothetical protein